MTPSAVPLSDFRAVSMPRTNSTVLERGEIRNHGFAAFVAQVFGEGLHVKLIGSVLMPIVL